MKSTPTYQNYALDLLRFYPRAWRERYADEAAAILEERPATLRTLFDLLLGLLDAYLHIDLFAEKDFVMLQKLRNSQINIFGSFVFCAPFLALYSLTGPWALPSWHAASPTPDFSFVFPTVRIAVFCAVLASLIGGSAFIAVALKQALSGQNKQSFQPFFWSLLSIIVVAILVGLIGLVLVFHPQPPLGLLIVPTFNAGCAISLFLALIGNLLRLRQGVREARLSPRFMQPTLIPGILGGVIIGTIYFLGFSPFLVMVPRTVLLLLLALLCVTLVGALIGSVVYLVRRIRRTTFTPRFLRFTFVLAALTALAMLIILFALLFQVQAIDQHTSAQGWKLLSLPLLHIILLCTALPAVFSCISLWRGFQAQRALTLP